MQETHVWNERLDLNHEVLDGEHHLQIAMIGALTEALEQRRPWMAQRLADQIATYSAAHFEGEQLVMETSEYPRAEDHRAEHQAILDHIDEIRDRLAGDELDDALPLALDLLTGLGSHIDASDRAFARHVEERRRARSRTPPSTRG